MKPSGQFHLEHNWGREKAVLGFERDRIRTLVSMATDSSNRVVMGNTSEHSNSYILVGIIFILVGIEYNY